MLSQIAFQTRTCVNQVHAILSLRSLWSFSAVELPSLFTFFPQLRLVLLGEIPNHVVSLIPEFSTDVLSYSFICTVFRAITERWRIFYQEIHHSFSYYLIHIHRVGGRQGWGGKKNGGKDSAEFYPREVTR